MSRDLLVPAVPACMRKGDAKMNMTELKKKYPTFYRTDIVRVKEGRRAYYYDYRTKQGTPGIDGLTGHIYDVKIVQPIACKLNDLFFVCPYCQRIHQIMSGNLHKGEGHWCFRHINNMFYQDFIQIDLRSVPKSERRLFEARIIKL